MAREKLLSSHTTASAPAHVTIFHNQLRDLLACPQERGIVTYVSGKLIVRHDIRKPYHQPVPLAHLDFEPNCLVSGSGLLAAGGGSAELYIGALPPSPSNMGSLHRVISTKLSGPKVSINNSLLITQNNLTAGSSTLSSAGLQPRIFVSNNDQSIKVYNIALPSSSLTNGAMAPAGILKLETPVNHTSLSPDGRTMLSVGDTNEVFLYNVSPYDSVSFDKISTYKGGTDANFSTSWSSDGRKFAVACQDGSVTVWDTRSSQPLSIFRCGKQPPESAVGYVPSARTTTSRARTAGYRAGVRGATSRAPRSSGNLHDRPVTTGDAQLDMTINQGARYQQQRNPTTDGTTEGSMGRRVMYDPEGQPYDIVRSASRPREPSGTDSSDPSSRITFEAIYREAVDDRWDAAMRGQNTTATAPETREARRLMMQDYRDHITNYSASMLSADYRSRTLRDYLTDSRDGNDLVMSSPSPSPPAYWRSPSSSSGTPPPPAVSAVTMNSLNLPSPEVVLAWQDCHPTVSTYGEPGRGPGSWMDEEDGALFLEKASVASVPVPDAGSASRSGRNAARVLKFSPGTGSKDVLVFTEDSSQFHVIDAQTFNEHAVVTIPHPSNAAESAYASWDRSSAPQLPEGIPHISGMTFDPSGGWLYVGTQSAVYEWEIERLRGWSGGYVDWA